MQSLEKWDFCAVMLTSMSSIWWQHPVVHRLKKTLSVQCDVHIDKDEEIAVFNCKLKDWGDRDGEMRGWNHHKLLCQSI